MNPSELTAGCKQFWHGVDVFYSLIQVDHCLKNSSRKRRRKEHCTRKQLVMTTYPEVQSPSGLPFCDEVEYVLRQK